MILPVLVTLKRFLAPLWVFIFGMGAPCWLWHRRGGAL
jgi:hypothetical protein